MGGFAQPGGSDDAARLLASPPAVSVSSDEIMVGWYLA
jgi:hypothetical protein